VHNTGISGRVHIPKITYKELKDIIYRLINIGIKKTYCDETIENICKNIKRKNSEWGGISINEIFGRSVIKDAQRKHYNKACVYNFFINVTGDAEAFLREFF
jgi:hypothetical protein